MTPGVIIFSSRAIDYQIKIIIVLGKRNFLLSYWSRESKRRPINNTGIILHFRFFLEFEGKSLLLKIPHTLDTGLE